MKGAICSAKKQLIESRRCVMSSIEKLCKEGSKSSHIRPNSYGMN